MQVDRETGEGWSAGKLMKPIIIGLALIFALAIVLIFMSYRQAFFARLGPSMELRPFVILDDGGLAPFSSDRLSSGVGLVFKLEASAKLPLKLLSQIDDGAVKLEWAGEANPLASGQVIKVDGQALVFRFEDSWRELKLCVLPRALLAPQTLPDADSEGATRPGWNCFRYQRQNLRNVFP